MDIEALDIKGVKAEKFNKKGIYTIEDLANFLPRKYYDFRNPKFAYELQDNEYGAIVGTVIDIISKNNASMVSVKMRDGNNKSFGVTFFNQPFRMKTINKGCKYLVCGIVKIIPQCNNYVSITNPVMFTGEIEKNLRMYPVYSKIEKTSEQFLQDKINSALAIVDNEDYLEPILLHKYHLTPFNDAKRMIHQPKSPEEIHKAQERLLFDDLFQFNFNIKLNDINISDESFIEIKSFAKSKELMDRLPFELTDGQRLALRNISNNMRKKKRVKALVQGDVGCGKTLVAVLLLTVIAENGYQGCLVAPTEILASQHYDECKKLLEPLGFSIGFLSGKMKKSEQKKVLKALEEGAIDIVVGTHSLMTDKVVFKNLGMSIVDEEHRFGVEQREALNKDGIHSVSMSATPIPRTIAMSMYGVNIEVETIKSLPKGRQPIDTNIVAIENKPKVYDKILEELKKGRQAYIICPLIKESKSDNESMKNIANVYDEYENAVKFFEKEGYKVGFVTGDNGENKDIDTTKILNDFKNHDLDVLIATTIIEVGVNVPNSTIIAILNAERFGFAQLHQLRGRVGRGSFKSYCYIVTDNVEKFKIFTKTNDGFEISKEDLILRGAGTFLGTQQSGDNKYLMLILANEKLNENIREDVEVIFNAKDRFKRYRALRDKDFEE